MKGTYKFDIRDCIMPGKNKAIKIATFTNLDVDGGNLVYSVIGQ